ncbi:MAG: hypothetical protein QXJ81_05270, partial [Metallosphaera sp.]
EWWKILSVMIGVAAVIALLDLLGVRAFLLDFYVVIGLWIFTISYANSAFISEPIWLDMNVMNPLEFARYYVISKALSVLLMLLPISLIFLIVGKVGVFLSLFLELPLSSITIMSLYSRFYQVNFQNPMTFSPSRFLVGFITVIPLTGIIVLTLLPLPMVMIGVTAFELLISVPFLLSRGYWERVIEKIMTS